MITIFSIVHNQIYHRRLDIEGRVVVWISMTGMLGQFEED